MTREDYQAIAACFRMYMCPGTSTEGLDELTDAERVLECVADYLAAEDACDCGAEHRRTSGHSTICNHSGRTDRFDQDAFIKDCYGGG